MLTFYLDGNLLGLDISAVKEMDRHIEYTAVPDAPPHIIGLMNMRGQIVTLFDLAGLMGYGRKEYEGGPTCIILKNRPDNPDYVGFIIDSPGEVVDISEDMCEPPPANLGSMESKFVTAVAKLESELLLLIDQEVIFAQ